MAKVLATKLGEVLNKIFSPNQYAFLKGIMLVDSVAVVNEVIGPPKKSRKPCLVFKFNFDKSHD